MNSVPLTKNLIQPPSNPPPHTPLAVALDLLLNCSEKFKYLISILIVRIIMVVTKASWDWNDGYLSKLNSSGIPNPREWKFSEIFDLDYICEQHGGQKIASIRLPFAPYTASQLEDHAETLYRVEDFLVHNVSRGWYPNRKVNVLSEGGLPDHEIVRRFKAYYGVEPKVVVGEQTLAESEASILREMQEHKQRYDTRNSPVRLLAKIVESAPQHMREPVIRAAIEDIPSRKPYLSK